MKTNLKISDVKGMTREELIFETIPGSLIAFNDFQTFDVQKACADLYMSADQSLLAEIKEKLNFDREALLMLGTLELSPMMQELAEAIGQAIEETMPTEEPLW